MHEAPSHYTRSGRIAVALVLTASLLVFAARLTLPTPRPTAYGLATLAWALGTTAFPVISGEQSRLLDVQWLLGTSFIWPALLQLASTYRGTRSIDQPGFDVISIAYVAAGVVGALRIQSALRGLNYFAVVDGLAFALTVIATGALFFLSVWSLRRSASSAARERALQVLLTLAAFFGPWILISRTWPASPKGNASVHEATAIVIAALLCGIGLWSSRRERGRMPVLAVSFVFSNMVAGAICIPLIAGEIGLGREPYAESVGLCWTFVWAVTMAGTHALMPSHLTAASREVVRLESAAFALSRSLLESQDLSSAMRCLCEGMQEAIGSTWASVALAESQLEERGEVDTRFASLCRDRLSQLDGVIEMGSGPVEFDKVISSEDWDSSPRPTLVAGIEWSGERYGLLLLGPLGSRNPYRAFHQIPLVRICTAAGQAFHDISIRIRQEQSDLEAARGSSALFLAHDIKGQLVKLDRNLEDLAAATFDETHVLAQAAGMRRTTRDLVMKLQLFLSRRKDDRTLPLEDVIEGAVLLLSPTTVVVRPGSNLPLIKRPQDVQRVLENLLRNAVEASTNAMKGRISIYARKIVGATLVDILDRGQGIPSESLELIFAEGYSTRGEGRGFGLTGARLLAQELGAGLTIGQRKSGGTFARLTLPDECGAIERTGGS